MALSSVLQPGYPRRALAWQPIWFSLWLGVTIVALFLSPDPQGHGTHRQLGLPPCPTVLMLDRPCPGCGLTTSFTATVHGHLATAFRAHALGPLLYGLFTLTALLAMYGFWKGRRLVLDSRTSTRLIIALGVLFFAYGAYRMLTMTGYATQGDLIAAAKAAQR